MRYLTFALAKGRLAEQTMDLLERIGMPCEEMKEKSRKLIFVNEDLKYSLPKQAMCLLMLSMAPLILALWVKIL